jgi:hypothetical protein
VLAWADDDLRLTWRTKALVSRRTGYVPDDSGYAVVCRNCGRVRRLDLEPIRGPEAAMSLPSSLPAS